MKEINYKIHLSDKDFFAASANDSGLVVGRILARDSADNSANLRHMHVSSEYRHKYGIGTKLHDLMIVWAKENNVSLITTELVPKNPEDYTITLLALSKMGYVCNYETKSGYKFGFVLSL